MGVETVAVMACNLNDDDKPKILLGFLEAAAAELRDFRDSERARRQRAVLAYKLDPHAPIGGFWALGDEDFFEMYRREGEVGFELHLGVSGNVGRNALDLWTSIRKNQFLSNPSEQKIVRRLACRMAAVVGADKVIYVPDSGDKMSLARDMVGAGRTFDEIVAFVASIAQPLPTPPPEGLDLYALYPDVEDPYFIDDFTNDVFRVQIAATQNER